MPVEVSSFFASQTRHALPIALPLFCGGVLPQCAAIGSALSAPLKNLGACCVAPADQVPQGEYGHTTHESGREGAFARHLTKSGGTNPNAKVAE
jgi:hypothetical protein